MYSKYMCAPAASSDAVQMFSEASPTYFLLQQTDYFILCTDFEPQQNLMY